MKTSMTLYSWFCAELIQVIYLICFIETFAVMFVFSTVK